ncbi:amino acid transporter [Bacillus sp. FJAT-25509]|uniref:amino acid permease n=1 Tax=Bacillaceae TaxID=186817 RepID=UPI0006FCD863|nr:amino acid permease [Bacillus sp. FJAT-25509]KQL36312.1 amino acid transporter [Bacillus sp. FJAT-25509]
MDSTNEKGQLQRSMKSRHLFMISLGGVIGTGLFLGSGLTINQAGPGGAVVAYLFGGLVMYLVMVCLGELSITMPVTGSFKTYATKYIGPGTGFTIGWMYWLSWATTVGLEFTAAGILMQRWFPHVPVWIWCLVFIVLLLGLNILSVKGYAEAEFWFAGIKVFAVIAFILIGAATIFGFGHKGSSAPLFTNFTKDGGLFPHGFSAIFSTMMAVVFAFQGAEVVGIAAGESEAPEKTLPKAIRSIIFRVLIFYVLAILVLAALIPWRHAGVVESPFVAVFDSVGIPYAADIMNLVILTALLSVGNSGLYVCSRMLWSLSKSGMAPKALGKVNSRGVPFNAVLFSLLFALVSLLTSVVSAQTVFVVLLSVTGLAGTFSWMAIALSQYNFRRQFIKNGGNVKDLKYKVPLFPLIPILCLVLCGISIVFMAFDPTQRSSLMGGLGFMGVSYLYYFLRHGKNKGKIGMKKKHGDIPTQQSI